MFGDMKQVYWLSKKYLSKDRENNIEECFNGPVGIKYPKHLEEFDVCLDFFKEEKKK